MFFEINNLIVMIYIFNYIKGYVDSILTVDFLNFLRKLAKHIVKV